MRAKSPGTLCMSHLSAIHYVEVLRRLSLSIDELPLGVAVVCHAVGKGPYL